MTRNEGEDSRNQKYNDTDIQYFYNYTKEILIKNKGKVLN